MSRIKDLIDAILRVFFGHNMVDGTKDWHEAHRKASRSRSDIERTIKESDSSFR